MKPPLKLLIGPLFNPAVLGCYQFEPDIKIFTSEPLHLRYAQSYAFTYCFSAQTHFKDLLAQLPPDWHPDWVIWWDLVYQALPLGIEDCPYPTAVIPGDWNLSYLNVRACIEAFDYVLGDRHLCQRLRQSGYPHTVEWKCFSFESEHFGLPPTEDRPYDITFIGNMNPLIHPKRNQYLHQIQQLHAEYQVFMGHGIFGPDYVRLLQQSKIVFNYTICQVMNMRAYEAPACGALLFIEEHNLEIRDILPDEEACILYNADNLQTKLRYYLEHPQERQRIAQRGYERIQAYNYGSQFKALLGILQDLPPRPKPRAFTRQPLVQQALRYIRQRYYATTPEASRQALQQLEQLASQLAHNETAWSGLITLATSSMIMAQYPASETNGHPAVRQALNKAIHGLQCLPAPLRQHPVIWSNLAWAYQLVADFTQASDAYQQALLMLAQPAPLDWEHVGPWIQPGLHQQTTELLPSYWEYISYKSPPEQQDHDYRALLQAHCHKQLAGLAEKNQQWAIAAQHYQAAMDFKPYQAEIPYYLARLYFQQNQETVGWAWLQQFIGHNPLRVEYLLTVMTASRIKSHAHEIISWLTPYLATLHSQEPQVKARHSQVQLLFQLSHLTLWLAETTGAGSLLQQKLWHLDVLPETENLLQDILHLFDNETSPTAWVKALLHPIHLHWQSDMAEPRWLDEQQTLTAPNGWPWLIQTQMNPDPARGCFLRSHDQPTDLLAGILGPDCWPWFFAPINEPSAALILSPPATEQRWLFFADQLLSPVVQSWIDQMLNQPRRCPLWLIFCHVGSEPAPDPSLLNQWSTYPQLEFIWLEDLTPASYACLLTEVHGVVGLPQGNVHYLLWWAIYAGIPTGLLSPLAFHPYPSCLSHDDLAFLYQPTPSPELPATKSIQAKLHLFYRYQALPLMWQTYWHMRLNWLQHMGLFTNECA